MGKRSRQVAERRASQGGPSGATESTPAAPDPPQARVEAATAAGPGPHGTERLREVQRALRSAQRRQVAADRDERLAVDELRRLGASWHDVGLLVGLTSEGARKRYSRKAGPPSAAR